MFFFYFNKGILDNNSLKLNLKNKITITTSKLFFLVNFMGTNFQWEMCLREGVA